MTRSVRVGEYQAEMDDDGCITVYEDYLGCPIKVAWFLHWFFLEAWARGGSAAGSPRRKLAQKVGELADELLAERRSGRCPEGPHDIEQCGEGS